MTSRVLLTKYAQEFLRKQTNLNKYRNEIQYWPKILKIAATRRWHLQLFFYFSYQLIVRVKQRSVTQNLMRKIRTILDTWSLRILQIELEISQNVSYQGKHFFLTGIHFMQESAATTRHGFTGKRSTNTLNYTGNLLRKNLQLKDVC